MRLFLVDSGFTDLQDAVSAAKRQGLPLRLLISFYGRRTEYVARLSERLTYPLEIFADSGAFSAFSLDTPISLNDYAAWVKTLEPLLWRYANLDVIGDPLASDINLKRLEDKGLSPVPVFHIGDPWEMLERYAESYPMVALGGMVPYLVRPSLLYPWLTKAFSLAHPRTQLHGFGCNGYQILSRFPFTSADSSAWVTANRNNRVIIFDDSRRRLLNIRLSDKTKIYPLGSVIRSYGVEPSALFPLTPEGRAARVRLAAGSLMAFQEALNIRYPEVVV